MYSSYQEDQETRREKDKEEEEKDNIKTDVLYPFWFWISPRDFPHEDYRPFQKSEINHFRKIMFSK